MLLDTMSMAALIAEEHRLDKARHSLWMRDYMYDPGESPGWCTREDWNTYCSVDAELYESADVRERFLDAMTPGARGALLNRMEAESKPLALRVGPVERAGCRGACCDTCGIEVAPDEPAAVLSERAEGGTWLEGDVVICLGCITQAALGINEGAGR